MARTLQHNRSSYALDTGTRGTSGTVPCGKAEKRFTASDVEYSLLKALTQLCWPVQAPVTPSLTGLWRGWDCCCPGEWTRI